MAKKPTTAKVEETVEAVKAEDNTGKMNKMAIRICMGQSPDLPIRVRVERIKNGLSAQGFDNFKSLVLPLKDYKRYL